MRRASRGCSPGWNRQPELGIWRIGENCGRILRRSSPRAFGGGWRGVWCFSRRRGPILPSGGLSAVLVFPRGARALSGHSEGNEGHLCAVGRARIGSPGGRDRRIAGGGSAGSWGAHGTDARSWLGPGAVEGGGRGSRRRSASLGLRPTPRNRERSFRSSYDCEPEPPSFRLSERGAEVSRLRPHLRARCVRALA